MMNNDFFNHAQIQGLLKPHGLLLIGSLYPSHEDSVPDVAAGLPARQLLLVGNGGSSIWSQFSQSAEFADGLADPLDRWSRRVGSQVAHALKGRAIFPFDGPPFPPFLAWAAKTGHAVPSRLSLFIHQQYGLWHAYRFALALPERLEPLPDAFEFESPCLSCADKPCLEACPVNAFSSPSYRADRCMDYLREDSNSACRQLGCAARRACPVGKAFTYLPEQACFHMNAFVASRYA